MKSVGVPVNARTHSPVSSSRSQATGVRSRPERGCRRSVPYLLLCAGCVCARSSKTRCFHSAGRGSVLHSRSASASIARWCGVNWSATSRQWFGCVLVVTIFGIPPRTDHRCSVPILLGTHWAHHHQVVLNMALTCSYVVRDTGIEPVTSSVSGKRSPAELIARALNRRWRRESNPCARLCRPLPHHSATPPLGSDASCTFERMTGFEPATLTLAR